MENTKWLIWSIEHDAWWAPNRKGYSSLAYAGVYSYEDALAIVKGANYCLTLDRTSDAKKRNGRLLDTPQEAMILLTPEIEKQLVKDNE